MSKNSKLVKTAKPAAPTLGRKRDPALDENILQATLDTLAEVDFDKMTMDMVAAKAKAGKATLYRRWDSKGELVRDALIMMSHSSVSVDKIPDTGSLRGDLLAIMKPYTADHNERKMQILAGLGSFFSEHKELADETQQEIYEPWRKMNILLMQRALEKKEISAKGNIELASDIIVATVSYRIQIQRSSFSKKDYEKLLEDIIIPALQKK